MCSKTLSNITSIQDHCKKLLEISDYLSLKSFLNDFAGYDLYDSCVGQLITLTRNRYVKPGDYSNEFLELVKQSLISYFAIQYHSSLVTYDEIYIYNGRMAAYRSLMRFCQHHNISFKTYEYPLNDYTSYTVIPNNYIHDEDYFSSLLLHHPDKGQTHDFDMAVSWLENRVNRRLEGYMDELLTKKLSKLNDDYILSPGSFDSLVIFFTSSVNEL